MDNIYEKIWVSEFLDWEIIQEMHIPEFDINLGDENNWSLLMCAVCRERKELVEYLLTYPDININHRSYCGDTVLYCCNQISILKLLLDRKDLDVNIQNNWGEAGLHHACFMRRKACVREYLLDARVNVLIRDTYDKETALDIALRKGYSDIAKIIRNSRHTTLLRIQNKALLYDIVRMIIDEYV